MKIFYPRRSLLSIFSYTKSAECCKVLVHNFVLAATHIRGTFWLLYHVRSCSPIPTYKQPLHGCQPDEPQASLATNNRCNLIYVVVVLVLLFMYALLHCLYSVGVKITTTTVFYIPVNYTFTYFIECLPMSKERLICSICSLCFTWMFRCRRYGAKSTHSLLLIRESRNHSNLS